MSITIHRDFHQSGQRLAAILRDLFKLYPQAYVSSKFLKFRDALLNCLSDALAAHCVLLRRKNECVMASDTRHNGHMCVVAFSHHFHPRWRLLLAGNRDEFHARPTAALTRWPGTGLLAGRDLVSGGTWVGLDARGRVAVVTNVRDGIAKPHSGPSRGALPVSLLGGALDAAATSEALLATSGSYAPFNLMLADADGCWHLGNHPRQRQVLAAGVHGISNGHLDAPWPKTRQLTAALLAWVMADTDNLQGLWDALADEHVASDAELPDTGVGIELERQLSPAFIRGEAYGTRASTIVAVDHAGRGFIHERRFGPGGVSEGETVLRNGD